MNAVQIAISKTHGLLYVDETYQCWVFTIKNGCFSDLQRGSDITFYATNGFGEHDAETVRDLIHSRVYKMSWYYEKDAPFDYPVIEDACAGIHYASTTNNWYEQVVHHPCLVKLTNFDTSTIGLIQEIQYSGTDLTLVYTNESLYDLDDMVPLTDQEIDELKSGVQIPEQLASLTKEDKPVLCFIEPIDGYQIVYFAKYHDEEWDVVIGEEHYPVLQNVEDREMFEPIPITHEQLDSFKCGI